MASQSMRCMFKKEDIFRPIISFLTHERVEQFQIKMLIHYKKKSYIYLAFFGMDISSSQF
jgi:hypothetical protein